MITQSHSGTGDNINVAGDYYNQIVKHPSLIADVINALANSLTEEDGQTTLAPLAEISITDKISYNGLDTLKDWIDEHKIFQGKIDGIYNVIESSGSNKKFLILNSIRSLYLRRKAEILLYKNEDSLDLDVIKTSAISIFDFIIDSLRVTVKSSTNIMVEQEGIDFALSIIVVDAFIRCKILEEPI